jgi:serine phosphatase RsbU (regulator of sigma subunit)
VLPDGRISRSHCRIVSVMGELYVADLGSSNGTFVNGERVSGTAPLPIGARLQVGSHVLEHEWRVRREVEESQALDRDIDKASHYIQSLLPPPLGEGPVRCDWILVPCARLGGDAFGYRFLDPRRFAMYLIDVSGHGAGAAMHAVSVINVLRQAALPGVDFADPASVLKALDAMFRMETHGGMYLTVWYGVYDLEARSLAYASAGHPPAYLVDREHGEALALRTRNPVVGAARGNPFSADLVPVPASAILYVFSDGVFEITLKDGEMGRIDDFVASILKPPIDGVPEPQRLLDAARDRSATPELEDDFTLLAFNFPE